MSNDAVPAINTDDSPPSDQLSKLQSAVTSLAATLPSILHSDDPSFSLLHDPTVSAGISASLRHPNSGAGDDKLCRWLYDAFQSGDPILHLAVLRHIPLLTGIYLSRASLRRPLPGFEAILLSLYARETITRAGLPVTVTVADVANPSLYHETSAPKNGFPAPAPEPSIVSPALEPHGTVRSTRRAAIVGVALENYYARIGEMPRESKLDFCHVCRSWAGEYRIGGEIGERAVPLPWELLQPIMRVLGHCVVGDWVNGEEVFNAAMDACGSLHVRAVRESNAKAILATQSLLRIGNVRLESLKVKEDQIVDSSEITVADVTV